MAVWNSTTSCPSSKSEYVTRGQELGCQEGREYHCLLDHNGVPGEICVPRTWVEPENCPEYNTDARKLDVYFCNETHGACPPVVYWSNTSFQYSGCMYIKTPQTNTTEASTVSIDQSNHSSFNLILAVPVVLGIVVAVTVICIALLMYRRRKLSRDDEQYRPRVVQDSNDHERIPLLELDGDMLQKGEIALKQHHQDTTYIPTQGFIWTTVVMLTHNVAVISGIVGSGKSKTALHTASTWTKENEHRRLLLIESMNETSYVLQRKLENVIIIMDDCFMRWTLECTEGSLSSTCAELYHRVCHSNNVKLVITIDYNIYQRHKTWLSHMDLFKEHLIITLPIEMAEQVDFTRRRPNMEELLQEERGKILQSHIDHHNAQENHDITERNSESNIALQDRDRIIEKQYVQIGFPSVSAMFVRLYEIAKLKSDFFQHCDTRILKLLEMKSEGVKGKQKRCILSYAMLRDNCIDLDELDLGLLNKLGKRYKLEPYDSSTVRSVVKEMTKTHLIQLKNRMFKIAYTVMFNKHINYWIQIRPHDFLELCSITLVKELIRPDGYKPLSGEPIFVVKKEAYITHLAQRFKELLPRHPELKNHPMMANKDFKKAMEEDEQKREFADNLYDNYDNTYEKLTDLVPDPERGEADDRPLPPLPKEEEENK